MKAGRILVGSVLALLFAVAPAAAAERTITMKAGPFELGPFQTLKPKIIVKSPKVDGYITWMHAKLVDARGEDVLIQRVMLHHVVFLNRGRFAGDRESKCGARFGEPFYGTGEENQALLLPAGYGYRNRIGDKWKMQTMLMSHNNQPQRVYVQYTMKVTTSKRTAVTPYWVRATNCRNEPSYSVPGGGEPGSVHYKTNLFRVAHDGYIVAGGAHLHGGAHNITLRQPGCKGRRLMASDPAYGMPDDMVYNVKPVLHEPGPVNTAWFLSKKGVAVRKGEMLRATAVYDAEFAHPGVMGVWHIYVAEKRLPRSLPKCPALPADAVEQKTPKPVREDPPRVIVPLTTLDPATASPVTLAHPDGRLNYFASPFERPVIDVDDGLFKTVNLSVAAGTTLTWVFNDPEPHKVQLANGPRSIGSPTLTGGRRYERTFNVPGVYQLFCYLHPMTMHQELTVRPGDDPGFYPEEGEEAVGIAEEPY